MTTLRTGTVAFLALALLCTMGTTASGAYTVSNATDACLACGAYGGPSYEVYDCEALVATFSAHAEAVAYVRNAILAALPR